MLNSKNIVATVGEYDKDGEKKKIYQKIGKLIEKEGKSYIKIETIPINWNGWAGIYDEKEKTEQKKEDDLPF